MDPRVDNSQADDWALVRLAASGDRNSVGELYKRYSRELYAFLVTRVGRSYADDVFSDVWIKLLQSPPTNENSFRGWLYKVAKNRVIDVTRTLRRSTTVKLQEGAVVADCSGSPDVVFEYKQKQTDLLDCLSRLESEFRDVMTRHLAGEDHATICTALGIPAGTSHSRLSRARGSLKECMDRKGWMTGGETT